MSSGERILEMQIDWGRTRQTTGVAVRQLSNHSYVGLGLCTGLCLEESLLQAGKNPDSDMAGNQDSDRFASDCLRIVCSLALLSQDSEIIEPDVLDAHKVRFSETGDQKYIDKAVARGKRGWLVGSNLEVDPHYRRPHFALRWTGVGGAVPQIVPVKGCVVKRHRLTEVPTGYLDK